MATRDTPKDETPAADVPTSPTTPPPAAVDDDPKAGPGQVVVTSPTGIKSVVEEHHVDSLKPQGYTVG